MSKKKTRTDLDREGKPADVGAADFVGGCGDAFSLMQEDLDKEKEAITKQWAKLEEQIERVMQSTVGRYGDLQGIAG